MLSDKRRVTNGIKLLMTILGMLLFVVPSGAGWWDCGWRYRIPITVQDNSGSTLTDYQVLITVDTQSLISTGKMNNDCSDIRFTYYDGGSETEIAYWIESGCGTTNTKIWVKVPSIPASGSSTIYMYYGNPTPSSSTLANNPDQVFEFFDDFEDGSIDSSKWSTVGTVWETTDPSFGVGVLEGEGGNNQAWICSVQSFNAPIVVEYRMRPQSTGDFDSGIRVGNIYFISDTGSYGAAPCISTSQCYPSGSQGGDLSFHIYRAVIQPTSQSLRDLTSGGSTTASLSYSTGSLCLVGDSDSTSRDTFYDWILVRKYASAEPTVTVGSEEYPKIISVTVTSPSNETWATSDIVTIDASIVAECPYSLTCTLQTTYPASNSFDMVENGTTCSIDLDLNGLVNSDGTLRYKVLASTAYDSMQSDEYVLYVDTSHTVSITSPANNTVVKGSVSIEATSSSILDITSCLIETSLGNFSGTLIGDSTCRANIDLSDSCPDDLTFRVWMTNSAGVTNVSDWYRVDNDIIYDLQVISPADGSYVDTDTPTIKISYSTSCKNLPDVYIDFTYPSSETHSMTCTGTTCSYIKDLNYFVQPDGRVDYTVRVVHPNEVETVSSTFYVPTSHTVTITQPTEGSIVLGSGFIIKAKSDSVLKIDDCYISLPTGAVVEKKIVDPANRYCELWIDLSNYCGAGTDSITFDVTMENTAGVNSTSPTRTHYVYDPTIVVDYVAPTPSDGANLSLRYLPIKVQVNKYPVGGVLVPTTRKFYFEINGVNYTVYGDENGYATLELFHPNLTSILGTDGSGTISFKVYGLGRCNYAGEASLRTVNIPAKRFGVNFVPPTPSDGQQLNILFMEVQGEIDQNILAYPKCSLEVSKDNGFSWIKLKDMNNCYAYLVNEEFDLSNLYYDAVSGYYVLKYRINLTDSRWGESNLSVERTVYIPPTAEPIPTVNPGGGDADYITYVQSTIDNAIKQGKPAVLFKTGTYRLNLVIDPKGQPIRLIGANSVLEAASKGYPVITVKSGNVTLERFTIKNSLFNIKVESGYTKLKDVSIYGGLYGIEVKNSIIDVEDSYLDSKLTGIKAENIYNSKIINTISKGKVWGMYLINPTNVYVNSSTAEAKVFGVYLAGTARDNLLENVNANAKVFGILINAGTNNTIKDSRINAQVFGIKLPGNNNIQNVVIDGIKVFGIYAPAPINLTGAKILQAKVFGIYLSGNASNVEIYNSKLGANLVGSGTISYLTLGDTTINITYTGNIMISEADPKKNPEGVVYTGKAVNKLGNGKANITFVYDNPYYYQYSVYNILGTLATLMSNDKNATAEGVGIYALYMS